MFAHYCLPHTGGVETVVEAMCTRLATRHRVTLVSTDWNGLQGAERAGQRTTWRLPAHHGIERLGIPYPISKRSALTAVALAEVAEADVIHVHGALYAQSTQARRMARRFGTPLVLTEHVGWVPYPSRTVRVAQAAAWRLIGDTTLRQASAVVALNERVRDWLTARVPSCAAAMLPNGVDFTRFPRGDAAARAAARLVVGLPPGQRLGLFVGRDAPKKHRAEVLSGHREGWTLVLAGATRRIVAPGVIDLGIVEAERMPLLYQACDFLVHLAEGEGFPMAVQESMASGLPVALRWDPGYASTLDRDAVSAGDTMADTMAAADALAVDAGRRERLGGAGHAWATTHWSWDATVAAYEAIYARVTSARALRGSPA